MTDVDDDALQHLLRRLQDAHAPEAEGHWFESSSARHLRLLRNRENFTRWFGGVFGRVWQRRGPRTEAGNYRPSVGSVKQKTAPCGSFGIAQSRPPWASTIERLIASPMPMPLGLVV